MRPGTCRERGRLRDARGNCRCFCSKTRHPRWSRRLPRYFPGRGGAHSEERNPPAQDGRGLRRSVRGRSRTRDDRAWGAAGPGVCRFAWSGTRLAAIRRRHVRNPTCGARSWHRISHMAGRAGLGSLDAETRSCGSRLSAGRFVGAPVDQSCVEIPGQIRPCAESAPVRSGGRGGDSAPICRVGQEWRDRLRDYRECGFFGRKHYVSLETRKDLLRRGFRVPASPGGSTVL